MKTLLLERNLLVISLDSVWFTIQIEFISSTGYDTPSFTTMEFPFDFIKLFYSSAYECHAVAGS